MKKEIIIITALLLLPYVIALDCPNGLVNDPYPGSCGLYIDKNNDSICDNSQVIETDSYSVTDKLLIPQNWTRGYHFPQIAIIILIVYLISLFLSKKEKISLVAHRRFWNLLLLISFLGVGISGIFLVLRLDFGINIYWPFNLLFWHVETGITMTLISICHIIWHFSYFKSYIKRAENKVSEENKVLQKKLIFFF
jgi:hypothetical protein